jgi:hypothetical protein
MKIYLVAAICFVLCMLEGRSAHAQLPANICVTGPCDFTTQSLNNHLYLNTTLLSTNSWSGQMIDSSGILHNMTVQQISTINLSVNVDGKVLTTSGYSTDTGPSKPAPAWKTAFYDSIGPDIAYFYLVTAGCVPDAAKPSAPGSRKLLPDLIPCT